MSEQATRIDYADRIARVVTWLSNHLDHEIDLARLADIACFSPYHFHRIYHGMQGETVADTVRRLRLHRAAVELIAGSLPIDRVATRAGYGSQEAFTRAFRAAYGDPPARYRASFAPLPNIRSDKMSTTTQYEVVIRECAAVRVAALPHKGDYQEIGKTFERLAAMGIGQGLFGPFTRSFGIYYDDPKVVAKGELRSEACMFAPPSWLPNGELIERTIRGGKYAVLTHIGPYAELHRAYDWLFGSWLTASGEDADNAPCIEEYLNDPRTLPPTEWKTEVWLPLR